MMNLLIPFRHTRVAVRGLRSSSVLFKDDKKALLDLGSNLQKGNLTKKKKGETDEEDTEAKKALLLQKPKEKSQDTEATKGMILDEQQTLSSEIDALSSAFPDSLTDIEVSLDASISEMNEKVSRMSIADLQIAKNFNLGRGMFAQEFGHCLDRRALIKQIPDEIDLSDKKQMIKLDETYKKLQSLDSDRHVHNKYFRRYLGTDDEFTVMQQDSNNIGAKFKLLRRGQQQLDLSLDGVMFEPHVNNFNLPHNVVGVDCTLNGLPLYKSSRGRAFLPQEFVRDLMPFETKVVVHKKDADFVEEDGGVMQEYTPRKNIKNTKRPLDGMESWNLAKDSNSKTARSMDNEDWNSLKSAFSAESLKSEAERETLSDTFTSNTASASSSESAPSAESASQSPTSAPVTPVSSAAHTSHASTASQSYLLVDNIHNYNIVNLHSHRNPRGILPDLIKMEVLAIQSGLQHEIEQVMTLQANVKNMFYGSKPFKVNAFKLCNKSPDISVDAVESSKLDVKLAYYNKDFNMLPNYSLILNSLAQLNRLRAHILKLFLINLHEHTDILFRIKYDTKAKQEKFMGDLVRDINEKIINDRLIPKFDTLARKNIYSKSGQVSRAGYDALIHSPYKQGPFKRIYWLNNKFTKKTRRRAKGDKSSMRILTTRFDGFAWY